MTDEVFRKAIGEALHPEFAAMIPEHGEHIFSEKFERKMERLIRRRRKPYYSLISTSLRRTACIIVMFLVVSFTTVMSVEALRKPFLDFISSIFSDHTTIESVLDLDGDYPEKIEDEYFISELPDGFVEKSINRNESSIDILYTNGDKFIIFSQNTKDGFKTAFDNEHNEFSVFTDESGQRYIEIKSELSKSLIWDNGTYIFTIDSNLDKNTILKLFRSGIAKNQF